MPLTRNVRVLGLASLLNDIASEIIYPLLPQLFLTQLGGSRALLGVMEGIAESIASLLKLYFGKLSDGNAGRKGLVLLGYSIAGLSRPLAGFVWLPWQLVGLRIVDRIGKGMRTAPRDALIAESSPVDQRARAFGFHRAMDHLGAAIGPLLATAFLIAYPGQLRMLFLLSLIPGIILVVLLAVGLKEAPLRANPVEPSQQDPDASLVKSANFRLFLGAMLLFTLGNSSDSFLLVRAGELGVPVYLLPALWTAFHVVKSAGSYLAGPAIGRLGARPMIIGGWIWYAAVYVGFALSTNSMHAWGMFLAYGIFYALTEPAQREFVAQLVGKGKRGAGYGWYHFAIGIAAFPSSAMFGWLYQQYGSLAAFGTGAAFALAAAVVLTFVRSANPPAAAIPAA